MHEWIELLVTVVCAVLASSGLWAFIQAKREKKDARMQVLVGVTHDRIIYLGMKYIERGWITNDEYENLYVYLYQPYLKMGGNGSAQRIMEEVKKLPIHKEEHEYSTHIDS